MKQIQPLDLINLDSLPKSKRICHRPYQFNFSLPPPLSPPPNFLRNLISLSVKPNIHLSFSIYKYMHNPPLPISLQLFQLQLSNLSIYLLTRMETIKKSQLAKIFLLVFFLTLLFLAPFVSSSMRTSYLYFILNLLIVVLGAEAGFLSAISKPHEEKKPLVSSMSKVSPVMETVGEHVSMQQAVIIEKPLVVEEKKKVRKEALKRCKSRPSLFFISSCEPEREEEKAEVEMEEEEQVVAVRKMVGDIGDLSKQELFMKAEMFIGNFHKQLKMQRENSWQKLQGLYHKAF